MVRLASDLVAAAGEVVRRLNILGKISDEKKCLTRTFLSPAMRRANAVVEKWIQEAGLVVREDSVGNLVGRWEARQTETHPQPKTLLLGSHLDTVRDAGRFDGPLGVLLPIAALNILRARGFELPFAVEILGFSEEEGVRFSSAYLGSKAYAGLLRASDLRRGDQKGISVQQAIESRFARPWRKPRAAHRKSELLGYVEVHIEQGPILEEENLAVGVVSVIAGQTRGKIAFQGKAGHAGTTPMALRRDALTGAAEWILAVEKYARKTDGVVATVGAIEASPGAPNVIAGRVNVSLDVRHERDASRLKAVRDLLRAAAQIARRRDLKFVWEPTQANDATLCSPALSKLLGQSVAKVQGRARTLMSGAGHDGVVIARVAPVAMLFVRCRGGLSHHPDEFAEPADIAVALAVLVDFLERCAVELSS